MASEATPRVRITIDVTPELRRWIRMAAAARDLSLRDYLVTILEMSVPVEDWGGEKPRGRLITEETIERFRRLQSEQESPFEDDSTDILRELRRERSESL